MFDPYDVDLVPDSYISSSRSERPWPGRLALDMGSIPYMDHGRSLVDCTDRDSSTRSGSMAVLLGVSRRIGMSGGDGYSLVGLE